ncbi:LIM/homeobox protein Lhx9-like protein [Leptotrombidium deliense]|uniref:LIM/homeobox protein Lhx9-like protein n=1 Tax=Leptotrombidium deliense TaxID=299467 RepID=A0A443S554_9ACAR|nr:LIM/homeobox protein Lhx9-like protein [Leptotrombidium deliense]
MRTSFKHNQLRMMKAHFGINHNPDSKDLKELSQSTGLSKRVLQVWFQNARAKWRRNILRQQSQGPQVVQECKLLKELDRDNCHLITSSSTSSESIAASISPDSTSLYADCELNSPLPIHHEEQSFYKSYLVENTNRQINS